MVTWCGGDNPLADRRSASPTPPGFSMTTELCERPDFPARQSVPSFLYRGNEGTVNGMCCPTAHLLDLAFFPEVSDTILGSHPHNASI